MSTASKTCPGGSRSHTSFTLLRSSTRSPVQSKLAGHFWILETSDVKRLGAPESTLGDEWSEPVSAPCQHRTSSNDDRNRLRTQMKLVLFSYVPPGARHVVLCALLCWKKVFPKQRLFVAQNEQSRSPLSVVRAPNPWGLMVDSNPAQSPSSCAL